MSHGAALGARLERFTQRNKAVDSCSKSLRKDFLCKGLGSMQLAEARMLLCFKITGSFPLPSVKNKGDRGAWEP